MKKTIAILLTFCIAFSALAFGAYADDKVYALTMGVYKYAANHTVSDGGDIATVTYLRHSTGETGSANHLYDVRAGEVFTLTTAVNADQEAYYAFNCWLDMRGAIISYEPTLEITIDGSTAVFAAYTERADRHLVTCVIHGEGSVSFSSDHRIEQGIECATIMHGASVSIKLTPAKKYCVTGIKVNGEKVSFMKNAFTQVGNAVQTGKIKNVFNALLNIVKFCIGKDVVYTIPSITADTTFEVTFYKSFFE